MFFERNNYQLRGNFYVNNRLFDWLLFALLAFIWGSSFILMKEGLIALSAFQVASVRIVSSGIVLLPIALRHMHKIPAKKLFIIFLSGVQGSLLPAYLFCLAEENMDSALAGTLNTLTPVFVILIGALVFKSRFSFNKILGVIISLSGSVLLFLAQPGVSENNNVLNVGYVVIATIMYGTNVNMVGRYLSDIPSTRIAAIALFLIAIPAGFVLWWTGYFSSDLSSPEVLSSSFYSAILGVVGTAIASVIFYILIKRRGAVFSSTVTYAIPVVALAWGLVYGETVGWKQVACLALILSGVYIANRAPKPLKD